MDSLVIAHKLEKAAGAIDNASVVERHTIYSNANPAVQSLISGAKKGVSRSSTIGCFEKEEDGTAKILERLLVAFNEAPTSEAFVIFSKSAVAALKARLEKKVQATGGYVIFVYYQNDGGEQAGQRYLVVALVTDQNIPAFDEDMNLLDSTVLDLEKLKHGARIRMSSLADNADGVVSLLPSKKSSETAGYFSDFIGCRDFTNSREMAVRMDERLNEWCESENMSADEISNFRFKAYSHWKDHNGARDGISIESLGNSIYPDGNSGFVEFMTDDDHGIPGQTPPIRAADMNRFRKFKYSAKGLRLEFDTGGQFNWKSKIQVTNGNVIITDAPEDLINQIEVDQNND
ncbi:MAG: nucleoid-associated protein [Luteolibacter sp.]